MSTKHYAYVRINVKNARGKDSTISIPLQEYGTLASLARGSATTTAEARVAGVCREAARQLLSEGKFRKLSVAVRKVAHVVLTRTYREEHAQSFDQAQFPEGTPAAA